MDAPMDGYRNVTDRQTNGWMDERANQWLSITENRMTNFLHFQSLSNSEMTPVNASIQLVELTSDSSRLEANDVTLTALASENIVNTTAVLNEVCGFAVTLFLTIRTTPLISQQFTASNKQDNYYTLYWFQYHKDGEQYFKY